MEDIEKHLYEKYPFLFKKQKKKLRIKIWGLFKSKKKPEVSSIKLDIHESSCTNCFTNCTNLQWGKCPDCMEE